MDDIALSIRPDKDDYSVFRTSEEFGKWRIGFIRHAEEINGRDKWLWAVNVTLPIPPSFSGRTSSLAEAQVAFRKAWQTFLLTLRESDLRHAFERREGAGLVQAVSQTSTSSPAAGPHTLQ